MVSLICSKLAEIKKVNFVPALFPIAFVLEFSRTGILSTVQVWLF